LSEQQWQRTMTQLITNHLERHPKSDLTVGQMCTSLALPRATFYRYRHDDPAMTDEEEMELRDAIQRIALAWPAYGYRRITAESHRRRFVCNHKRVLRLMREDNLLCLRAPHSFLCTTDSRHAYPLYENLAADLTVTGLDQLWVADITYIRLLREFIYLAVILDAFSRRVIGWELSTRIDTALTLAALQMAIEARCPGPGLVHHSDRGVQYASHDYTQQLLDHHMRISMSRKGNPYDNAQCERFIKTLKYEEVYLNEYENLIEARSSISRFIEKVYNRTRLHSALGYLPPAEFEQALSLKKVS
jgi:putative transposase